jgi:hypothetical protein
LAWLLPVRQLPIASAALASLVRLFLTLAALMRALM